MSEGTRLIFLRLFIICDIAAIYGFFVEVIRGNGWVAVGFVCGGLISGYHTLLAYTDSP